MTFRMVTSHMLNYALTSPECMRMSNNIGNVRDVFNLLLRVITQYYYKKNVIYMDEQIYGFCSSHDIY